MYASYQIVLTSAANPLNCQSEFIKVNTSLSVANEAKFAQAMTNMLSDLYAAEGREMLCVWELDAIGNESAFFQSRR